jgi:hypothetical protein
MGILSPKSRKIPLPAHACSFYCVLFGLILVVDPMKLNAVPPLHQKEALSQRHGVLVQIYIKSSD